MCHEHEEMQLFHNNGISTEPLSILFSFIVTHQLFGWFTGIEILIQIEVVVSTS